MATKTRVNAGGMTESQVKLILRLAGEKAWESEPRASYRERTAMLVNDLENNPATSPLTGGWGGTASKLIDYLNTCPKRVADNVSTITELLKPDPWGQAHNADQFPTAFGPLDTQSVSDDPWTDDATTAPEFEENDDGTQGPRILGTSDEKAPLVGPGVYVLDNEFYSVKESTKNPGRHYAHRIVLEGKKFRHVYAAGVIFKLTEEMRASANVVIALNRDTIHEHNGKRVGSCCVCGRMLTKKSSIDAGIGPICGGRVGL